jgi:hypothetical protein
MKKTVLFIAVVISLWISGMQPDIVEAHILQTDTSIGAVLHVDPEDDPIVGQPASFFFEFKDKTNKFTPDACTCTVSIVEQGKEMYTQSLFQNSTAPNLTTASFSFTFPQKDVYQLKVNGMPTNPGTFQPFTLVYDLRVSREETAVSALANDTLTGWILNHIIHIVVISVLVALTVIVLFKKQRS